MIGNRYENLVVISQQGSNDRKERLWLCQCDCGNTVIVKTRNLTIGKVKSCGCLKTGPKIENLVGQKFNKLTVLEYFGQDKWRSSLWFCECECGKNNIVSKSNLESGNVKSCGCLAEQWKHNKPKGAANPLYNNAIARTKRNHDLEAKEWARQVKKRDNYTCQRCNKQPSNFLVSHHLYSYTQYKHLRYNMDNGVTLCQDCHQMFHEQYGFFANTKEQYERWINEQL